MVVAEIPLWLAHAGGEGAGANGILGGGGNPMSVGENIATDRDVLLEGEDGRSGNRHQAAHSSLGLLQNSGRGGKCAIFGVDINSAGTRIATCGSDGTVRLWSVSTLFSRKRSRFNPSDGNYESSEASCEDSSRSDNDDNPSAKDPINDASTEAGAAKSEAGAEMDAEKGESRESMVHDLSKLVRRKKGGEVVSSPSRPSPSSTAASQPSQSSPSKQVSPSKSKTSLQKQKQHQRLLCTLSAHTGSSVMAVRFSHTGRFLASAGDDTAVCIYTKESSAGGILGNLTDQSPEPWSRIKLCRGHGLDVVGLAWAPDDSHLVSCSLDRESPIIVWKLTDLAAADGVEGGRHHFTHSNILCHPYKILGKGIHTSTVKGVTFDPAGTYLASSGDDPAVCIWRAHDDWGLERRIDAASGIFRKWKEESLSSQSLFRRLSWSTDGAFICSTNCVVKNKHVASTISREGWNVSTARSAAAGAANLVGHKQPVVVSRHCSLLLDAKNKQENEESNSSESESDDEPAYATLLALGDRSGFVTIWSTRKSRPIFKLQCSESRAQVTDLAWGKVRDDAIILLVSLMDGHCVALRFKVPDEIGPLLPNKDQARLFKFRYGIDVDDAGDFSRRRLFVGDSSGPKFIENALQMSLENRLDKNADGDRESDVDMEDAPPPSNDDEGTTKNLSMEKLSTNAASVKAQQEESQSKGKKRIRPVLMSVDDDQGKQKISNTNIDGGKDTKTNEENKETDPLKHASDLAEKAASVSNSVPQLKRDAMSNDAPARDDTTTTIQPLAQSPHPVSLPTTTVVAGASLQYNTNKIQSVDLPVASADQKEPKNAVATCTNSFRIPFGSKGPSTQCIDLSICTDGSVSWKDQIVGTSCSAIAAAKKVLAVGTADGAIQLYGTSPSLGWGSGTAFRSHPLLVLGQSIVALQLHEPPGAKESPKQQVDMLVVTADGSFGVYQIVPELRMRNKGSIMPAMTNMALGMGPNTSETRQPKLSRIQITESDQVLLLLSLSEANARSTLESSAPRNAQRQHAGPSSGGAYGSIQAFVYNLPLELWMRISDGRFVLSDFYSTLPNEKASSRAGVLARLDDSVRTGALESSLAPSHRRRANAANDQAADIYQHTEEKANFLATRSHCEDRMACALALGSSSEFKQWLSLYVRTLVLGGHTDLLRVLVEMLLSPKSTENGNQSCGDICWWLSSTPQILNMDRKSLIRNVIIAEMSKNRSLQRLTNEIQMELDSLTAS